MINRDIAICADRNVEIGLHVTLLSLLLHLSKDVCINIHIFTKDLGPKHFEALRKTLVEFDNRYNLITYDLSATNVTFGKHFHGNYMPYAKVQVPNIIKASQILLIDADLIILTDISKVFCFISSSNIVGVAHSIKLQNAWSKERVFLRSLGIPNNSHYFNSGVMLIDVNKWRQFDTTNKCVNLGKQYKTSIHTGDQTLLNAILHDSTYRIPEKFNILTHVTDKAIEIAGSDCIYHLVGSPKPWDLFGEFIHSNYSIFQLFLQKTVYSEYKSYKCISFRSILRSIYLSRSYFVHLKRRMIIPGQG